MQTYFPGPSDRWPCRISGNTRQEIQRTEEELMLKQVQSQGKPVTILLPLWGPLIPPLIGTLPFLFYRFLAHSQLCLRVLVFSVSVCIFAALCHLELSVTHKAYATSYATRLQNAYIHSSSSTYIVIKLRPCNKQSGVFR